MPNSVGRETYVHLPVENKLDVLYDISISTDKRVEVLEKRKRFDTTVAGFMGFVGGAVAMVGKWIMSR